MTESNMKLRKCPFCGGEAKLCTFEPDPEACTGFGGFKRHLVRCTKCGVAGPCGGTFDAGKKKAAELWNRRHRMIKPKQEEE